MDLTFGARSPSGRKHGLMERAKIEPLPVRQPVGGHLLCATSSPVACNGTESLYCSICLIRRTCRPSRSGTSPLSTTSSRAASSRRLPRHVPARGQVQARGRCSTSSAACAVRRCPRRRSQATSPSAADGDPALLAARQVMNDLPRVRALLHPTSPQPAGRFAARSAAVGCSLARSSTRSRAWSAGVLQRFG